MSDVTSSVLRRSVDLKESNIAQQNYLPCEEFLFQIERMCTLHGSSSYHSYKTHRGNCALAFSVLFLFE